MDANGENKYQPSAELPHNSSDIKPTPGAPHIVTRALPPRPSSQKDDNTDGDDDDGSDITPAAGSTAKLMDKFGTSDRKMRRNSESKALWEGLTCAGRCSLWIIIFAIVTAGAGWFWAILTFVYAGHVGTHLHSSTIALGVLSPLVTDIAILTTLGKVSNPDEWTGGMLTWSSSQIDGPLSTAVKVRIFIGLCAIFIGLIMATAMIVMDFEHTPGYVFVLFANNAVQIVAVFLFWQASEQDDKPVE